MKKSGIIYWFLGDLRHLNAEYKTTAQVAKITDAIVDESMIKFDWLPNNDFYGGFVSLINDLSDYYSGMAKVTDHVNTVKVTGELFENKSGYVLKGTWIEEGEFYTWFAEINKKEN